MHERNAPLDALNMRLMRYCCTAASTSCSDQGPEKRKDDAMSLTRSQRWDSDHNHYLLIATIYASPHNIPDAAEATGEGAIATRCSCGC